MADDVTTPPPPAELELKLPEGYDAKAPEVAEFRKLATESKLDGKAAQALFDLQHKTVTGTVAQSLKTAQQKSADESAATRKQWADAAAALPEQAKLEVQRVMAKYGDKVPAVKALFDNTGLGNHPAMVQLLQAIGKDLAEDTISSIATSKTAKERGPAVLHGFTLEEVKAMYPKSPEMWASLTH